MTLLSGPDPQILIATIDSFACSGANKPTNKQGNWYRQEKPEK
jgi:hypothetical protein